MITNIIMNKLIGPAAHLLNTIFYPSMSRTGGRESAGGARQGRTVAALGLYAGAAWC